MFSKRLILILALSLGLILAACSPGNQPASIPETGGTAIPDAVNAAVNQLSQDIGVDVSDIRVVSFEQTDWQDACLGLGGPEESCAQVVVPGFRVVLEVNGQQYEIRTDQTGEVIRQVTDQ